MAVRLIIRILRAIPHLYNCNLAAVLEQVSYRTRQVKLLDADPAMLIRRAEDLGGHW
ncbi:hypothetical protein D3C75_1364350 [compost metagenome]